MDIVSHLRAHCPDCGSTRLSGFVVCEADVRLSISNQPIGVNLQPRSNPLALIQCRDCHFKAGQVHINWPSKKHDFGPKETSA